MLSWSLSMIMRTRTEGMVYMLMGAEVHIRLQHSQLNWLLLTHQNQIRANSELLPVSIPTIRIWPASIPLVQMLSKVTWGPRMKRSGSCVILLYWLIALHHWYYLFYLPDEVCVPANIRASRWHVECLAPCFQAIARFTQNASQKVLHTCRIDLNIGW